MHVAHTVVVSSLRRRRSRWRRSRSAIRQPQYPPRPAAAFCLTAFAVCSRRRSAMPRESPPGGPRRAGDAGVNELTPEKSRSHRDRASSGLPGGSETRVYSRRGRKGSSVMQMPAADLDRLGDEIAELSAHLQAATARLLDLIREFDAQGGWNTGFRTCAAWLNWRVGLDLGAARALHVYPNDDGTVVLRGRLTPEVGALVLPALAAAREKLYQQHRAQPAEGEPPTLAQQQADARALLAQTALHHGIDPGAPAERYQVVVHVDAPALADPDQPGQSVLEDGVHVPAETSRRPGCDASRVVMHHGHDGRVVEVAARTRTIPPALRRALQHRDQGGRFPGCGVPV